MAFDRNDTSFGCVDTLSVAPPYTVASLKSHIVEAEGILCQEIWLFEDPGGKTLMKGIDKPSFLAETFPGCLENEPLTLVYMPCKKIRADMKCSE